MTDESLEKVIGQMEELWVFGYGSILWNQGFGYSDQLVGYVDGYIRRFWQGNTTHRGTPRAPGRVATLIQHPQGRVWGVAYQLRGSNQIRLALDHLGIRECSLGGYACETLAFTERTSLSNRTPQTIPVLTFIAVPSNALYLGPMDLDDLASQIVACRGNSGTNVEYVLRMADYIHDNIPEDTDEHLFLLVQKIKDREAQTSFDASNSSYLLESSPKVLSVATNRQDSEVKNLEQKMVDQLLLAFKSLNDFRNLHDCEFQTNLSSLRMENLALSA